VKAIQQLIAYLEERGQLTPRQVHRLVIEGYWGQHSIADLRTLVTGVGKHFYFQVTAELGGAVWGSDVYTSDSALETVCVHAGLLQPGESGVVKVTSVAPLSVFQGSSRNGVISQPWDRSWPGAYRVKLIRCSPQRPYSLKRSASNFR